jgi:hypothetical protein
MIIELTNHAKKRLKERLGINYKACQRQAERAFREGDVKCSLENKTKMLIDYNNYYYVFGLNIKDKHPVLITVIKAGDTIVDEYINGVKNKINKKSELNNDR